MNKNDIPIVQQPHEQALEPSLQNLIKTSQRRQQWRNCLFSDTPTVQTPPRRAKLAVFLESRPARVAVASLLLADMVITTLELTSSLISRDPSNIPNKRQEIRETTAEWYHWLGVVFLGLLFARTATLAAALGGPTLVRRPGLVVDGAVLAAALVLEGFLERKGGGLVVVVSLWRVVRVMESAFELSDEAIESRIAGLVAGLEGLREENGRLSAAVEEKGRVIEKLREDLDRCREECSCLEHVA